MPRIRVLDFETQGFEPECLVCETGWCDVVGNPTDGWLIGEMGSTLHEVDTMPPGARAVHHISAEETQGFPVFSAETLWDVAKADGVDVVAAHNVAFDGQFWGPPQLPVICTFKSARQLWTLEAPSHGNGALRYWLEDRGVIKPDPALCYPPHRAGPDAYITAHVLIAMLREVKAAQMVAWTRMPCVQPTCPIGQQWRGKPWKDVDGGFLHWMIRQPDMEPDNVWNAQQELDRRQHRDDIVL